MKFIAAIDTSVEKLISEKMKDISKSKIKQWIKFKQVTLNGKIVMRIDEVINAGDVLLVAFNQTPALGKRFKPEFEILWEDDFFIAGLKPAGVLSVGESSERHPTFFKLVQKYVRENSHGKVHVYVIHRLDREVSGILLFAKSEKIMNEVKDAWKENTKRYYALVEGKPEQSSGRIESYLVEDPKTLKVYSSKNPEKENGKWAITHYKTLQTVKDKTLLEIELETGRKNQIRVHLSELGHPIVGDWRYGADDSFERQIRLYAYYLKFKNPVTQEWIEIKIPLPSFFLHLPNKNERYK